MAKYVRLKPYNRKEGHLLQRFTIGSKRMLAGRWYKVDDSLAKKCAEVHQPRPPKMTSTAPTPLAFDVTETKAKAEAVEKASKPKPPVEETKDLTTADLTTTDLTGSKADDEKKPRRSARRSRSSG